VGPRGPAAVVLALIILAAAGCSAGGTKPPSGLLAPAPSSVAPAGTLTESPAAPRPKVLVAITTAGSVQSLDPATGASVSTLATGATGDEISVAPDGSNVYFEAATGCFHLIMSVPLSGRPASAVAPGSHPTVSPDGTRLAYTIEPLGAGCPTGPKPADQFFVAVRTLADGATTFYPLTPAQVAGGEPLPIDHVSWAPDNRHLAVSIDGGPANTQWNVSLMDSASDHYYAPPADGGVPVDRAGGYYYSEAVFLPNGNLFVNLMCCAGKKTTSSVLAEVDPASGRTVHRVSVGLTDRDHTSLDADAGGHWLLYLAGSDLVASLDNATPTIVSTAGFQAADW